MSKTQSCQKYITKSLMHKIWCMILPNICDPKTYFNLMKTCKYFTKLVKRYNNSFGYQMEYNISLFCYKVTSSGPKWYGDALWAWEGQHLNRGDNGERWFKYHTVVSIMKERKIGVIEELLNIPYRNQIRRLSIPLALTRNSL